MNKEEYEIEIMDLKNQIKRLNIQLEYRTQDLIRNTDYLGEKRLIIAHIKKTLRRDDFTNEEKINEIKNILGEQ